MCLQHRGVCTGGSHNLFESVTYLLEKMVWPPKSHGEKRCEIQVGGQEMAVMVGKWQNF